jgi:mRNA-degrading endonuclease RelE of RelBE toxin-antitoxin system
MVSPYKLRRSKRTRGKMHAVAYRIIFVGQADEHIADLTAHRRARLLDVIEVRLLYEPTVETRNRKPMQADKKPYIAPWELRVDDMRVYYDVEEEPEPLVVISAVGIKRHGRLMIRGKEIES